MDVELDEVEQAVTDFLLTALEFPDHPDMGMLQCRKAIECIVHHKYFIQFGEYPVRNARTGKYPGIIDIWFKLNNEEALERQVEEVIMSINGQSRGGLHWDHKSRYESLKQHHVDVVIDQICNTFVDIFDKEISLKGLVLSEDKFGSNVKLSVLESIPEKYPFREFSEADIEEIINSLRLAEVASDKGISFSGEELLEIGRNAYWGKKFDSAKEYYLLAKDLFIQANNNAGRLRALAYLGDIERQQGNLQQAIEIYHDCLSLCQKYNYLEEKAFVLNNIANVLRTCENRGIKLDDGYQEIYGTAEVLYLESLAISRKIGYLKGIERAVHNLGLLFSKRGATDSAIEFYKQSIDYAKKTNNIRGVATSCISLAGLLSREGKFDEAEKFYNMSYINMESIEDFHKHKTILHGLGKISVLRGDFKMAKEYLLEGCKMYESHNPSFTAHNNGVYSLLKGENFEAIKYHKSSLMIDERSGSFRGIQMELYVLKKLYSLIGDEENTEFFSNRLNDSIVSNGMYFNENDHDITFNYALSVVNLEVNVEDD